MKIKKDIPFWLILTTLGAMVVSFSQGAFAQTVYTADFSTPVGAEWSDSTISTANSESFLATSSNGSGNGTNVLILTPLPSHTYVTVSFDLYIIQSWDGNGPEGGGPDNFALDSASSTPQAIFYSNFANYTGSNTQAYPAELPPYGSGANNAPRTGQSDSNHLGYGTGDFGDATYSFTCTFEHSGDTLDLAFSSQQNQAPGDEGWGLDNVVISVSNEPPTPRNRPCFANVNPTAGSQAIPMLNWLALIALVLVTLLLGSRHLKHKT